MEYFIDIILVFLLSTVKFAFAIPFAAITCRLSFHEVFLTTASGGITGVFFFAYLTEPFMRFWNWFLYTVRLKKRKADSDCKKINIKRSRRVLKIRKNYGLAGLAFFTPILISIPVGTFIAVRFFKIKQFTLIMLITFVILWSLILSYIITQLDEYYHYFNLW